MRWNRHCQYQQSECGRSTLKQIVDFSGDTDNVQLLLRYNENTPSELRDLAVDEFSKMMFAGASVEDTVNNIQAKADEVFGN